MNFQYKENKRMPFELTQGMDTANSPLGNLKLQLAKDVDFTDRGFKPRADSTQLGLGSATIYGYGIVKDDVGDVMYRIAGTNLEYYTGSSRTTRISGLQASERNIVSVEGPNLSTTLKTGTATTGTTRSISTSGLTDSAYVAKYLTITGGTGSGQTKLISANTTTEIFIEGMFDVTPDSSSTYDIRDREGQIYCSNGSQVVVANRTTAVIKSNSYNKAFKYMTIANNRIFGVNTTEDVLWFSDLGTYNFGKDNFILIDPDGDIFTGLITNQDKVVIYKQHSRFRLIGSTPEFFELIKSDSHKGAIAPKSICGGNNLQFFLSEEGIEMYNSLENSTIDEGLPISVNINSLIQSKSLSDRQNAVGCVIGNKMMMSIGNETFVYDIEQTAKKQMPIWSIYDLSFNNAKNIQGQMYHSNSGITYKFNKDTTSQTNRNITIKTGRYDLKDSSRKKNLFTTRFVFEKPVGATTINISAKYDGSIVQNMGNFDIYTNPEIRIFSNRIAYDVEYTITSTTNQYFEFLQGEISYEYLGKI